MKDSMYQRLARLAERYEEIAALLSSAEVIAQQDKFRRLSQEYAELEPVVAGFRAYTKVEEDLGEASLWLEDSDAEMRRMGQEELLNCRRRQDLLAAELRRLMVPKDPDDDRNVFLEIRAGTGGDEAAIFAGDLLRMYCRFADARRWKVEVISENPGEHGGYKEVVARVSGQGVYAILKFESGTHRVQRVPETESQGRIHTSACTIAVLPEVDEVEVEIDRNDLRIDTFRSSGAGGQHVNTTDSAIRITHLPSGIVVECQDERSQHKNRARAMALLHAKLTQHLRDQQAEATSAQRRRLVGSGDRSERIRTYNFPQGRLTDHRINLTLYRLEEIMEGNLDEVSEALINEYQADQLAALGVEE